MTDHYQDQHDEEDLKKEEILRNEKKLDQFLGMLKDQNSMIRKTLTPVATMLKMQFDALKDVGFTDDQAITIVSKNGFSLGV